LEKVHRNSSRLYKKKLGLLWLEQVECLLNKSTRKTVCSLAACLFHEATYLRQLTKKKPNK
jgi:hypothetical protein